MLKFKNPENYNHNNCLTKIHPSEFEFLENKEITSSIGISEVGYEVFDLLIKKGKLIQIEYGDTGSNDDFFPDIYGRAEAKKSDEEKSEQKVKYALFQYKKNYVLLFDNDAGYFYLQVLYPAKAEKPDISEFTALKIKSERYVKFLIADDSGGSYFEKLKIPEVKMDLNLNYGSEFKKHHDIIEKKLKESKNGGIYLFHGVPGSGKSTYIKYLASIIPLDFLYIPNNCLSQLESPHFLKLLLKHKSAVLIMEDAENAILKRTEGNQSLVSTILNITDGVLGSVFNLNIILTYNTEEQDLDPAIKRKGRCKYSYKFNELSIEDAKKVAINLKIDEAKIVGPMKLSDIYNLSDDINNEEKKAEEKVIGFAFKK